MRRTSLTVTLALLLGIGTIVALPPRADAQAPTADASPDTTVPPDTTTSTAPPDTTIPPGTTTSTAPPDTTTSTAIPPPVPAPKVRGVGDSVFLSAQTKTVADLQPEYRPSFQSVLGASIEDMTPPARRMVARNPAVMVIGMGNPDVALMADPVYGFVPYQWATNLLEATASVPCVVWINLKQRGVNPYYTPRWEQEAKAFNAWLVGAASPGGRLHYRNFHVINWNGATIGHSNWFLADGLHLNATGQAHYAAKIDRGLNRLCPP